MSALFRGSVRTPRIWNGTIALALTSFVAWFVIVMKYAGPKHLLFELFGNKADRKELPARCIGASSLIFLLVGVIEVVSILNPAHSRYPCVFLRNVFGGESLLHNTSYFTLFYLLEILVGMVQAFVFNPADGPFISAWSAITETNTPKPATTTATLRRASTRTLQPPLSRPGACINKTCTAGITNNESTPNSNSTMTGNIAQGMALISAAFSVGLIGFRAVEAVGRNPGASGKVLVHRFLAMALAEGLGILALLFLH